MVGGERDGSTEALLDRARAWADDDPDPATAQALRALVVAAEDGGPALGELRELFRGSLRFGTAGLRGAVGPGPDRMNRAVVRRAAAGVAAWVQGFVGTDGGVVVGRDARHGSEAFLDDSVEVLAGAGIRVHVLPSPVPTPVLAFAVRHLGAAAGIMVTASHNPGGDNGYKVYDDAGRQIDAGQADDIAGAMQLVGSVRDIPSAGPGSGLISRLGSEVVDTYVATVAQVLRAPRDRERIDVAHTSLHGVGAPVVRQACRRAGFIDLHEVSEQADADPDFPTVPFPNPEEPGALDLLLRQAAWSDADVAFANDPDADRLAMAVPLPGRDRHDPAAWRVLTGDELGCLLADHLVRRGGLPPEGVFATTIVSSTLLREIAVAAGFRYVETLTGFKWIVRAGAPGRPLVFGYEEALGYCVGDAVRDKDGISALLLAAEVVSTLVGEGLTVHDRLDDLARRFGVHLTGQWSARLEGGEGAERIAAAMARLRTAPPATLAGRVVAEVSDLADGSPARHLPPADVVGLAIEGARVVVRPSGTEPKLKCYVEVVEPAVGDDLDGPRARAREGLDSLLAALPDALGLQP